MPFNIEDVDYLPPLGADATTATPSYFSSPEDLLQAAQQTDAVMHALHDKMGEKKAKIAASVLREWQTFADGWGNYYATNFGSRPRVIAHWLTSNLQASLVNYQQQVSTWAAKLKKYGIGVTSPLPAAAPGGGKSVLVWIGIGAVVIAGLFIIGKLVHTVAFGGAAELEEAEDEAMKIAETKRRKRANKTALSIT